MIILDTNIVSTFMQEQTPANAIAWLDQYEAQEIYITSVTMGEVYFGIAKLPDGKRKTRLATQFNLLLKNVFNQHILPFTELQTQLYGDIRAKREKMGRKVGNADAQIGSIALYYGAILATDNIKDFLHCNINLVNPLEFIHD